MENDQFKPFVSPETRIAEVTLLSLLLGAILGVVMTAANTYLGLYAGMTVSASIPAAVISMGILKGIFRSGTILENNIVQTIASAGESLAAGIIFTIPALVITKVWTGFDYWTVTLIAIAGGVLGVLFMIPLRKTLITGQIEELTYPEGVACSEVLEAGEKGGRGLSIIMKALGLGALFKVLMQGVAINGVILIKGTVEAAWRLGKSVLYVGSDVSMALVGVGYIVGFNVGLLVLLGGALGWLVALPILALHHTSSKSALDFAWDLWNHQIRFMGVGAMIVGGLWSIFSVRQGIFNGIREALGAYRGEGQDAAPLRTNLDMRFRHIGVLLLIAVVIICAVYSQVTASFQIGGLATVIMVITAFFFVAVSSYIVGLVGSSNNPVSGMTICTLLFAAGMMLAFGFTGEKAILATLGIAGVVCCAACTAGDVSQDLKTGYLVGATPRAQQWAQMLGVLVPAFTIAPVMALLHSAYGIGTGAKGALKAPQASLFASIAKAMFSDEATIPWIMVIIGAGIGVVLIVLNEYLKTTKSKFRTHVMPVAVGIYLPLSLGVPIFIGGTLALLTERLLQKRGGASLAKQGIHNGILFSSGLIAGEAIAGILMAIPIVCGVKLPLQISTSTFSSLLIFGFMIWLLYRIGIRAQASASVDAPNERAQSQDN